mmetsp:Transcript_13661/g.33629  ORF Transcript_13661/g.33629 Transcript_13661/m.33629 type:complete len:304 (+) Transcript_13661:1332-2243(+)
MHVGSGWEKRIVHEPQQFRRLSKVVFLDHLPEPVPVACVASGLPQIVPALRGCVVVRALVLGCLLKGDLVLFVQRRRHGAGGPKHVVAGLGEAPRSRKPLIGLRQIAELPSAEREQTRKRARVVGHDVFVVHEQHLPIRARFHALLPHCRHRPHEQASPYLRHRLRLPVVAPGVWRRRRPGVAQEHVPLQQCVVVREREPVEGRAFGVELEPLGAAFPQRRDAENAPLRRLGRRRHLVQGGQKSPLHLPVLFNQAGQRVQGTQPRLRQRSALAMQQQTGGKKPHLQIGDLCDGCGPLAQRSVS